MFICQQALSSKLIKTKPGSECGLRYVYFLFYKSGGKTWWVTSTKFAFHNSKNKIENSRNVESFIKCFEKWVCLWIFSRKSWCLSKMYNLKLNLNCKIFINLWHKWSSIIIMSCGLPTRAWFLTIPRFSDDAMHMHSIKLHISHTS